LLVEMVTSSFGSWVEVPFILVRSFILFKGQHRFKAGKMVSEEAYPAITPNGEVSMKLSMFWDSFHTGLGYELLVQ
jgi:hypothetical protein